MKKLALIAALSILVAGGLVTILPATSPAQVYQYPPPPGNPSANPWVGSNTPWVYYNGDWFLNGVLYYFFGPKYGWSPYYSYSRTYIVRPQQWYGTMWNSWYVGHPRYWENFHRTYPYWHDHHVGYHYDQRFYEQHHYGQGGGWHKGYHGYAPDRRHEERRHEERRHEKERRDPGHKDPRDKHRENHHRDKKHDQPHHKPEKRSHGGEKHHGGEHHGGEHHGGKR